MINFENVWYLDLKKNKQFFQLDKPSKPQGPLVAKEVDKTSATMEWKPPLDDGGIELKGYVVEYSEIFTEQWKQVEEICPHPICHVQNLTEGKTDSIRLSFFFFFNSRFLSTKYPPKDWNTSSALVPLTMSVLANRWTPERRC